MYKWVLANHTKPSRNARVGEATEPGAPVPISHLARSIHWNWSRAYLSLYLFFFSQDLSKKDSALLKLGSELKDLETVQEELEKKEQELRTERNTVTEVD